MLFDLLSYFLVSSFLLGLPASFVTGLFAGGGRGMPWGAMFGALVLPLILGVLGFVGTFPWGSDPVLPGMVNYSRVAAIVFAFAGILMDGLFAAGFVARRLLRSR
jgi:hypothetical protein